MFIIDDILLAPFKGLWYLAQELYNRAWRELFDEEAIQKELAALQFEYELGNVSSQDFQQREAILMDRLRLARAARKAQEADREE